jgi:hypothetical protein
VLLDDVDDVELLADDELVEYLLSELEPASGVFTSVPKSVQESHTSSLAPSTLMVFGDDVSAPHISH